MDMKTIFSTLFLLVLSSFLFAQEPLLNANKRHELGTSIQSLINGQSAGHALTYRYHFRRSALRAGINLGGNSSNGEAARNPSSSSVNEGNGFFITGRLGYEGHIWLSPQWMIYIGGDVIASRNNEASTAINTDNMLSFESTNTVSQTVLGADALGGLRFQITPIISLGTELRYVGRINFLNQTLTRKVPGQEDNTIERNSTIFNHFFERPAAIYIQVNL